MVLDLEYSVPREAIEKRVPSARFEVAARNVNEWRAKRPTHVSGACMFIWDEMVDRRAVREAFKIGPIVNNGFKGIYEFVERELGRPPAQGAYVVNAFQDGVEESFCDVSLVKCYPSDIHICDVEFSDATRPLAPGKRANTLRKYHGLHVFGEFLDRLVEVGRSQSLERLSLLVAEPPLYSVFKKYGFKPGTTQMAQIAFKTGQGFPMILTL